MKGLVKRWQAGASAEPAPWATCLVIGMLVAAVIVVIWQCW